jgi:uncharacterized small protein (DUF1192 family)
VATEDQPAPTSVDTITDELAQRVAALRAEKIKLTEVKAEVGKRLAALKDELDQGERMLKALTPRTVTRKPKEQAAPAPAPAPETAPAFKPE